MDNTKLFKKLKQRYVHLENLGYDVLFIALNGSQNYGLDLDTEEYKSDLDCIATVLPSVEDIINSRPEVSTTIVLDNNEHITVKDIRQMFKMYQKQNTQFLETLFTDYKIVNKKYKTELEKLFKIKDEVASINRKSLYNNLIGIAMQKDVAFRTKYDNTIADIEKYGYSGKALYHQLRVNAFLHDLESGKDFKTAMQVTDESVREKCLKAKLCQYEKGEANMLNGIHLADTLRYKDIIYDCEDNIETIMKLDNIKANLLKLKFKEELIPIEERPYQLCPDHYKNVFVTSDTHFGHGNIIEYEHRDIKLGISGIREHDEELIRRWNSVVKPSDLVLILGDFSFSKPERTEEVLQQLNGDKVLIIGNHDSIFLENKRFNKSLFKGIYDYKEASYKGTKIVLMHYMIDQFKHKDKEVNPYVHLFGHIHSYGIQIPRHSFNVGTDVNNYTPVRLEVAIQKALENTEGRMNKNYIGE